MQKDLTGSEYPVADPTPVTLRGRLSLNHWSKSYESWMAGGSDYIVLTIQLSESQRKSFTTDRIVLRPTATTSFETLQNFDGKSVEIIGRRAGYLPVDSSDQNAGTERGGGLLVDSIQETSEPAAIQQQMSPQR